MMRSLPLPPASSSTAAVAATCTVCFRPLSLLLASEYQRAAGSPCNTWPSEGAGGARQAAAAGGGRAMAAR